MSDGKFAKMLGANNESASQNVVQVQVSSIVGVVWLWYISKRELATAVGHYMTLKRLRILLIQTISNNTGDRKTFLSSWKESETAYKNRRALATFEPVIGNEYIGFI